MTDDLVAFLRARLDEDAEVAEACASEVGTTRAGEPYADGSGVADRSDFPSYPWGVGEAELAHITRHDPARVLAEIKAKREMLLDLHATETGLRVSGPGTPPHDLLTGAANPMRRVAKLLAQPYADHPDYDESWTL